MILGAHLGFLLGGLAWVLFLVKKPNATVAGAFAAAIVLDLVMELVNAGARPSGYPQPVAYLEPHLGLIPFTTIPFTIPLYIAIIAATVSLFTFTLSRRYGKTLGLRMLMNLVGPVLAGLGLAAVGEYSFDALGVWVWTLGDYPLSGPVLGTVTVTLISLVSHAVGCLTALSVALVNRGTQKDPV